jgi:dipeptidyl aminopeptidase/acylaminoacyl peptidase
VIRFNAVRVRSTGATAVAFLLLAAAALAQQPGYSGLGAESVTAETIARYAPPPVDPAVSRRIQALLDVRTPGGGAVSPDGKKLYFSWDVTGSAQVWRLDGPNSFPVQMTAGEDATGVRAITPDGKWLILSRDVGGEENPGLYVQPAEGGPLKTIQKTKGARVNLGFVQPDSKTLYYTANDIKGDSYAIYRYDLATGQRTLLFSEPGLWGISDHAGEGDDLRLLLSKATGSNQAEIYEWTAADKKLTPLLGVGEKTEYSADYAKDPSELLVHTNRFGEFRRLYRWKKGADASEKSFTPVSPEVSMDVIGSAIDRPKRHIYYGLNDGGFTRLVVLDAGTFAREEIPLPKDAEHVSAGGASLDGRYVTLGVETGRAPRSNYVWDWDTKTMTQWVTPSAPEADLTKFVPAQLMTYAARDGTKIPMFVRFPKGCGAESPESDPCPVIVSFHGGPEGQSRPGFSRVAQLYVDAGFIYVEPNVRGSDGYGKSWLNADNGPKRMQVITDIDDCGKWIHSNWARNGKAPKIGIMGGSYGGYATLIGMTMFAGTYDAGASVVGISNLHTFLKNTAPYRRILRASEYGDPEKDADSLKALSPVSYLDRVKSPLLLIQGVNDPRVPVGEAVSMQESLEKRNLPSRLILIPDEGHGSAKRSNQVLQIGHILKFFEEHLKPKSPPAQN